MNALTFALVGLIFLFTVPKIYQVYQVRTNPHGRRTYRDHRSPS